MVNLGGGQALLVETTRFFNCTLPLTNVDVKDFKIEMTLNKNLSVAVFKNGSTIILRFPAHVQLLKLEMTSLNMAEISQ